MTTSNPPQSGDPAWKLGLQAAWKTWPEGTEPPDDEIVAAYVDGTLTEAEREQVEAQISLHPEAMSRLADLLQSETREEESYPKAVAKPHFSADSVSGTSRRIVPWIPMTTMAVIACAAIFWGISQSRQVRDLQIQTDRMSNELAAARDQADKLAKAQHRRAIGHKERFLALAENTRLRNFWAGDVTPAMLQLDASRGAEVKIGQAAKQHEVSAREALEDLATLSNEKAGTLLEMAALDIAAGRTVAADKQIDAAARLEGETPRVKNARALLLLADATAGGTAKAETAFRSLTQSHPDFLPGWYNLALLLEKTGKKAESKAAWHQYLKREDREDYRKIAQAHLAAFGN